MKYAEHRLKNEKLEWNCWLLPSEQERKVWVASLRKGAPAPPELHGLGEN